MENLDNIQNNINNIEYFLMTNHELRDIINRIEKDTRLNLTEIADQADVDRSYVSKIINLDNQKPVGKKVLSKFKFAFPDYFKKNNENNGLRKKDHLLVNDIQIKLSEYLSLLKEKATKAEDREKDYKQLINKVVDKLGVSLTYVAGKSEAIEYDLKSGREVVLQALSQALGHQDINHLLKKADKRKVDLRQAKTEFHNKQSEGKKSKRAVD